MPARGNTPKRRPVWVGKKQFPSLSSAAAFLSAKTGRAVWPSEVSRALLSGGNIGGRTVRESKPEPPPELCGAEKAVFRLAGETKTQEEPPVRRKPLLRYEWGERPLDRGLGGMWR
jgi:hypothetical protein